MNCNSIKYTFITRKKLFSMLFVGNMIGLLLRCYYFDTDDTTGLYSWQSNKQKKNGKGRMM